MSNVIGLLTASARLYCLAMNLFVSLSVCLFIDLCVSGHRCTHAKAYSTGQKPRALVYFLTSPVYASNLVRLLSVMGSYKCNRYFTKTSDMLVDAVTVVVHSRVFIPELPAMTKYVGRQAATDF